MRKITLAALGCAMLLCVGLAACNTQMQPVEHVHEWGEWTVTTAPTCTAEGEETRICELDASHTEKRSVAADPDAHEWGEWKETKAPTCTAEGEETRVCELDASHTEKRSVAVDPAAHEWGEWKETKAPTCTAEGEETRICELDASHTEKRSVAADPDAHEWGEWKETTAPTCTAEGEERRVCELDESHTETRTVAVDPAVHEWGEWKETKAPTCTAEGEETRICELDASHTETRSVAVDPDAHKWGEWKETKAPTYVAEGEETRVCTHNEAHKQTRPLAKLEYITESITVEDGDRLTATHQADKTLQLHVKIKYVYDEAEKDATRADVAYTSGNHAVATVNADGEITIVAPGTAEITIESVYNNESGAKVRKTVQLTVNHAPITEMTLTSSQSYSLIRGLADEEQGVTSDATAQIVLTVTYLGGTAATATSADVTFVSGDNAVASVDANGLITFNGVGTTTITVTSKYEKQGGGYMEKQIPVTVNDLPENTTKLEIISFEAGIDENGKKYLDFTVKNMASSAISVLYIDVYYVDATGKILGTGDLFVGTVEGNPSWIEPGEEIQSGEAGNISFVEGTVEILIYNRRIK